MKDSKNCEKTIIFVYNADSGIINGIKDIFVKTFKSQSYECNLCALTYNFTGMRRDWKKYIQSLGYNIEFLHKNELLEQHNPSIQKFPCVYIENGSGLEIFIPQEEMNAFESVDDIKAAIEQRMNSFLLK